MHPDFRPVARSAYRMSAPELQEVQKQLTELVDLGLYDHHLLHLHPLSC